MEHARLSATALANHLACKHLTGLEDHVRKGALERPVRHDPALKLLIERGIEHERDYVAHLRATRETVVDLSEVEGEANHARFLEAARAGADVIVQPHLQGERFHGYADVLLRVDEPSELGDWSYDVVDTKLAQETRGGTVLQLCLYADLLRHVQGRPAKRMTVVKPGAGFPEETFLFAEHDAYYRLVRDRLVAFLAAPDRPEPYPAPVPHCDVCVWWARCRDRRRKDDHLSLVAGMSTGQTQELERQGRTTLEAFADAERALDEPPRRGRLATFERLQRQAAVQLEGRRRDENVVELLPHDPADPHRGLALLPAPSPGDVYLDFEGDPYVRDGGLEYLTGYAWRDDDGALQYTALWALGRGDEKRAFERFLDFLVERRTRYPDLHVYHYAPYEKAALSRLAMRHATREAELDTLLRDERFIDLYAVTRQGLLASVESYSLKPLEAFFGYEREVELREEASPALRRVACVLEQEVPEWITDEDRAAVEGYNRDDCLSLVALQAWLEGKRAELLASGASFERPPLKDSEGDEPDEKKNADLQQLFEDLTRDVPEEPRDRDAEARARWLVAHQLEYFWRERKVDWWEFYARRDTEIDELFQERKAVVHLEFVEDLGVQGKNDFPTHRYRFPAQDVSFGFKDAVKDLTREQDDPYHDVGAVADLDLPARLLDIRKSEAAIEHHPQHVHLGDRIPTALLALSLQASARWIADQGVTNEDPKLRAVRDLLLRRPPRTRSGRTLPLVASKDPIASTLEFVRDLDHTLLAIQGPPGAGKTYLGARLILGLVRAGHRVGVSATSHKVIRNLLEAALSAAAEEGVALQAAHKPSSRMRPTTEKLPDGLEHVRNTKAALKALDDGKVVGGVAWLWASKDKDMEEALDYLFIDEAGQMSLAYVLSAARATKNLILLGDPQQLQQPQRGAHPEGADVSALAHLLGERGTIPDDQGLFLGETWRLPPSICRFTSRQFYDSRLGHRPHCEGQRLAGPTPFAGEGLFLVHADHEGNQSAAPEEVATVREVVDALLRPGVTWTDRDGDVHALTDDHLMIVAPYNAQVAALTTELGRDHASIPIGTVDRFQGQERPVVIYSMTSSSAEDAPRGMAFLYDLHRLNVATSRAQCVCIVVGAPALFEPECRSPEQIRLANALCAYREAAEVR